MMNKTIISLFVAILSLTGFISAQEAFTLQGCYNDAITSHPLNKQIQTQQEIWRLNDKTILSGWYPTINANANITYNTNVVDMNDLFESLPIPGGLGQIDGMPHDQYKLTVDINQVIWDGGTIKHSRKYEEKSKLINQKNVEIELYKTRENINQTYFGIILQKHHQELLKTYLELFKERIKSSESAIENGIILSTEKSAILAEKMKIEQQLLESEIKLRALCNILADICGKEVDPEDDFILPDIVLPSNQVINRLELNVLKLGLDRLEEGKDLINTKRLPKAFGFATMGYGSPPGLDFFNNSFGTYAVFGAGIKWNIFDWNNSKRNRQKIDLNKTIISSGMKNLEDNIRRAIINKQSEITSMESILVTDKDLIELRKAISVTSESQFNNGTITATEYMAVLNLEKEAVLSYTIHKINLLKAKVEYLNISGNEIN